MLTGYGVNLKKLRDEFKYLVHLKLTVIPQLIGIRFTLAYA